MNDSAPWTHLLFFQLTTKDDGATKSKKNQKSKKEVKKTKNVIQSTVKFCDIGGSDAVLTVRDHALF